MLLKACLNGAREPGSQPALPLTPVQLAADARRCADVGAGAFHVHPRDAQGQESLAPDDIAAALRAIRAACPGVPVGVSTGAWIVPRVAARVEAIAAWTDLPDFASVNFSETGALAVCDALRARGVGIEAGIATADDARGLHESGLAPHCLRVLIEPDDADAPAARATADAIIAALDGAHIRLPRLLHGTGAAAWPLLDAAVERGYDTRIGLEDTLTLPDGSLAADNAALVAAAHARITQTG